MSDKVIAVSHPGKIGDTLYALPTARFLCEYHQAKADFYTSNYCAPLRGLLEYQSFVRKVVIPPGYVIERVDMGVQPWQMTIPADEYAAVYQLGFRTWPEKSLPDHIAESVGAPTGLPVWFEFPETPTLESPYIVIAPGKPDQFRGFFLELARRSPIPAVVIGAADEHMGEGIDRTGLGILETLPWLARARGFVGGMSAHLVLANAFPIPKVVPIPEANPPPRSRWDMRHVVRTPLNYYVVNPSPTQALSLLGQIGYSKTLHPNDYLWIGEAQHVRNVVRSLKDTPARFEHTHRQWEYGIALRAIRESGARTLLDVGGGGSVFSPSAACLGIEVTQIDPEPRADWVEAQARNLNLKLRYIHQDFLDFDSREYFDAVTCISVIEHVKEDGNFFLKILRHVGKDGIFVLTTDFHPSAMPLVSGHLRTYNEGALLKLANIARAAGFEFLGQGPEYTYHGAFVNSYSFASLCMRRTQ